MANIILPQVDILSEANDNTNILIEQNGVIQRININYINSLIDAKLNEINNAEEVAF